MKNEKRFKEFLAQYCEIAPKDMNNDMRFIEDLGLSSFDFMSLLGDLEDNFDIDLDTDNLSNISTIGQALDLIDRSLKSA
jgi:acyl carrier protein